MRYRLAVADRLREKGFDTAYKVGKAMNKPPAQASRLMDADRTQINIELVNELCEFLGVTPGDLFARVDDRPTRKRAK